MRATTMALVEACASYAFWTFGGLLAGYYWWGAGANAAEAQIHALENEVKALRRVAGIDDCDDEPTLPEFKFPQPPRSH